MSGNGKNGNGGYVPRQPRVIDGVRWFLQTSDPAKNTPFKVQLEALRRAKGRRGYNWWMEVGLAKTTTALNEFETLRADGLVDFLAVVTLQSFKMGWQVEAKEFGVQGDIAVWPDIRTPWHKSYVGCIWNWESIIGSGGDALEKTLGERNVYLVLDEAHKIKNPQAKVTKRLSQLWKDAVVRRGMTGTPMSQSVLDLYPQLRLAGALEGVNPFVFRNRYAKMGGYLGKQIIGVREDRLEDLQQLQDQNAFRALKDDWLDLPERIYVSIPLVLPPVLQKPYREMQQEFIVTLDAEGNFVSADMVITQLNKLQQITSGFIYDENKRVHRLCPPEDVPKFQAVLDLIDSLGPQRKLLVFTHFRPTVEILSEFLEKKLQKPVCVMKGGMTSAEADAVKAQFNSDTGPQVLVAQASVAGAAHTLLGGPSVPCHTSIFVENSHNLLDRKQAEGRTHRAGQRWDVTYYDPVSSMLERDVIRSLQQKTDLVKAVVDWRQTQR